MVPVSMRCEVLSAESMAGICSDVEELRGPAVVTVLYFLVYYSFMVLQLSTRSAAVERARKRGVHIAEGKPFASDVESDAGARMGERVFLNTLEQMGAFLASLWMCALFVSGGLATALGGIAVGSRLGMPVLWSMGPGGAWNIRVEASTQPYYACVLGMLGAVLLWGALGINVATALPTPWLVVFVLGAYAALFIVVLLIGRLLNALTSTAYAGHLW